MSTKFYKTTLTVEVLTEGPLPEGTDARDIVLNRKWIHLKKDSETKEISTQQALKELKLAKIDPARAGLCSDGSLIADGLRLDWRQMPCRTDMWQTAQSYENRPLAIVGRWLMDDDIRYKIYMNNGASAPIYHSKEEAMFAAESKIRAAVSALANTLGGRNVQ